MSIDPIPGEPTRWWVQSATRKEVAHIVDSDYDGAWACSCEDCMVRGKECKHIAAVKSAFDCSRLADARTHFQV